MTSGREPPRITPRFTSSGKAPAMPKNRNLLFVIADDEHARFVRPALGNTFHSDPGLGASAAPKCAAAPPSGGQTVSSATRSSAEHAPASHHDYLALEKTRFCRAIAA